MPKAKPGGGIALDADFTAVNGAMVCSTDGREVVGSVATAVGSGNDVVDVQEAGMTAARKHTSATVAT
jgi:hypothetical protein